MKAKICGVMSLEDAKKASELGADFIGFVCCSSSKRYLEVEKIREIASQLGETNTQLVAVFLDEPIGEILRVLDEFPFNWVQMRAPKTLKELSSLEHLQKILVLTVDENGAYPSPNYPHPGGYWLYDSIHSGSGERFNWKQFQQKENEPFLIAGGLNPELIEKVRERFHPDGVDVSSGVCYGDLLKKDPEKMKLFIQRAHHEEE